MPDLVARIGGIRYGSLQEGPGRRTVLWFAGCGIGCPGCINPQLWPRNSGQADTVSQICERFKYGREEGDCGVTFVGGEPFDQPEALAALCQFITSTWPTSLHPPRLILYSGYTLETLAARSIPAINTALAEADVLVDGPFIAALSDPNLGYRGSANQRVIDLHRTLATGSIQTIDWDQPRLNITPDGTVIATPQLAQHLKLPAANDRQCGQLNSSGRGQPNNLDKTFR